MPSSRDLDVFLCCVTWDNHLPSLEKEELDFRTVTAPSSARAEGSGMDPGAEWGGVADGKLVGVMG